MNIDKEKLFKPFASVAGILIVSAIAIVINIIVGQIGGLRTDLTEENLYTLSKGTKRLLAELPRKVTLKFYFSKSAESTPIPIKQYAQRIQDMLDEYRSHAKGNVLLEIYDPKPDSDEEEWAQKFGLAPQGMSMLGGESIYLGIVASSGAKEETIPFISPSAEPQLEYLLTRLIHKTLQTERPKVGILSSLPVMGTPSSPYAPKQGPQKWMVIQELEAFYDLQLIAPDVETIADDITLLILIHPKKLADKALYALDQFVMRGGRLMAFVDPVCAVDAESNQQQQNPMVGMMDTGSEINKLTETWGYKLVPAKVVGDMEAATEISTGRGGAERSITWLSLRGNQINRDEISTSSLEFIMTPFAGYFEGEAKEGITATPIFTSSNESGTIDSFQAMGGMRGLVNNLNRQSHLNLALRLQGTFKTAFPNGPPAGEKEDEEKDEDKDQENQTESLKESPDNAVVILIADADMLYDRFAVRRMNFFGQSFAEPLNDNFNFVLNSAEQLTGSDALIGLRSRGKYERPFHRVQQLERIAQEKWQAEEQRLQNKVQNAQRRLNELQSGKSEQQRYILSPEQKSEIVKFREEERKTRKQLRGVRKNLRSDIEKLGMKLKVLNIAGVPIIVAVFGIFLGVQRKRKALQKR